MGGGLSLNRESFVEVCWQEVDDHALMAAMAYGQHKAFDELSRRHLKSGVAVAQRILGNAAEADEVVQEAFLKLWLHAKKWDPEGTAAVKTWLNRVITNLCLDVCRRRRTTPLDNVEDIADHSDSAFEKMKAQDRQKVIQNLLNELPVRQRAAVVHYYFEDLSGRDVAFVMGITEGAVESLLVRARRLLRKKMKRWGFVWGEDL